MRPLILLMLAATACTPLPPKPVAVGTPTRGAAGQQRLQVFPSLAKEPTVPLSDTMPADKQELTNTIEILRQRQKEEARRLNPDLTKNNDQLVKSTIETMVRLAEEGRKTELYNNTQAKYISCLNERSAVLSIVSDEVAGSVAQAALVACNKEEFALWSVLTQRGEDASAIMEKAKASIVQTMTGRIVLSRLQAAAERAKKAPPAPPQLKAKDPGLSI